MIGQRLGPYEVLAKLGEGGMGVVYRAEDTRLGRAVALKLLPDAISRDPVAIERFQREARAAAALNHPNICTIYDIGQDGDRHYLTMELLDGQTLRERLEAGPFELAALLEIGAALADALDAAHHTGIVHRDIKPANVFLTTRGQPKLLDFGLAKIRNAAASTYSAMPTVDLGPAHLTSPGTVLGTVAYMSPEQARGQQLDARTDLFSLGVVLYEMSTGALPFPGDSSAVIFEAILNRPPAQLDRLHPELSPVTAKALEKDRFVRYQSAADLRADLLRLKRDRESGRKPAVVAKAPTRTTHRRKRIESIAVLPLATASGNKDAEYLGDGIAESLINSFSRLPKLRVAQQHRSFRYKGSDVDPMQAARELNVQAILTGRILLRGQTLVVKVNLVDIEKDAQVWGQQFTREMADIFVLQDEIANEVMEALRMKFSGAQQLRAQSAQPRATEAEAYHLYLKGRYHWSKRTPAHTKKALEFYQQAIEHDPTYASAWAGMADCYALLGFTPYGSMPPTEAFPRAKAAAQKALALDDTLVEAHSAMALCAFWYDWDWDGAERAFRRALEIRPDNIPAYVWYSELLGATGREDEGVDWARRATMVDPLSAVAAGQLSLALYMARRHDEAILAGAKALELDPNDVSALIYVALARIAKEEFAQATELIERAAAITSHFHWKAHVAYVYGLAGRREEALRILDSLESAARDTYVSPFSFAIVHLGLGDVANWKRTMEACVQERNPLLIFLDAPWNDVFRDDPFVTELRRKIGLPARQR